MSDRGLPIVDGAQVCPFVAFENDRDERATSPDHRHRCYADAPPAPRALAHQQAYCLASSFRACPIFQDWASREAAQPRPDPSRVESARPEDSPRRDLPGDWSAPAPWSAGAAGVAGAAVGSAGPGFEDDDAGDRDDVGERDEDDGAPGYLSGRSAAAAAGAGLAGSAADRLAGDVADDDDRFDERAGDRYDDQLEELDSEPRGRPRSARASGGIGFGRDRRPKVGDTRRAHGWDEAGPSWERPRHNEPYPPLKGRNGPRVSRLGWMAIALVVTAIALFFLPQLLGLGAAPGRTGDGTSSPSTSGGPSGSIEPTPVPVPTPQIYIVKSGDSMFSIAKQFGITPDELIAANRATHPNPDQLQVGDQLIIPVPSAGGGASPSPEQSPAASP